MEKAKRLTSTNFLAITILAFAILLSACSCSQNSEVSSKLDLAESLMEERPDSALAVLNKIEDKDIKNENTRAKFALLLTMLKHKNYIDETNDSLIGIATDFYERTGDIHNAVISKYYRGVVLYNAQKYEESMIYAIEAEELSNIVGPLWMARTNELMADLYNKAHMYGEEIKRTQSAIKSYQDCGKHTNAFYAMLNLASAYNDNGEYVEAINTIHELEHNLKELKDSTILRAFLSTSLPIYLKSKEYDKVLSKFDQLSGLGRFSRLKSQDYRMAGFAWIAKGNVKQAEAMLDNAKEKSKLEKEMILNLLLEKDICKVKLEGQNAAELLDSLLSYQNNALREVLKQPISNAFNKHYEIVGKKAIEELNKKRNMLYAIVLAIIIFATVIALFSIIRAKKLKSKLDSKIEDAYLLSQELSSMSELKDDNEIKKFKVHELSGELEQSREEIHRLSESNAKLESMVGSLLMSQQQTINSLCEQYYEDATTVDLKLLYRRVGDELDTIREPKTIREITGIVNHYKGNVLENIKNKLPDISENDLEFLGLLLAGFSIKSLAVILKMKPKGIYSKRKRLFDKIKIKTIEDLMHI